MCVSCVSRMAVKTNVFCPTLLKFGKNIEEIASTSTMHWKMRISILLIEKNWTMSWLECTFSEKPKDKDIGVGGEVMGARERERENRVGVDTLAVFISPFITTTDRRLSPPSFIDRKHILLKVKKWGFTRATLGTPGCENNNVKGCLFGWFVLAFFPFAWFLVCVATRSSPPVCVQVSSGRRWSRSGRPGPWTTSAHCGMSSTPSCSASSSPPSSSSSSRRCVSTESSGIQWEWRCSTSPATSTTPPFCHCAPPSPGRLHLMSGTAPEKPTPASLRVSRLRAHLHDVILRTG